MNSLKQSQTKPNLPATAGKFALSAVEGPVVSKIAPQKYQKIYLK
jgi:hypothetical protein